jgi:hypothetical protein
MAAIWVGSSFIFPIPFDFGEGFLVGFKSECRFIFKVINK